MIKVYLGREKFSGCVFIPSHRWRKSLICEIFHKYWIYGIVWYVFGCFVGVYDTCSGWGYVVGLWVGAWQGGGWVGYNWGVLGGCMDACLSGSLPVVVQWAVIYDCRNLVIARIHRRIGWWEFRNWWLMRVVFCSCYREGGMVSCLPFIDNEIVVRIMVNVHGI
jgi:hypothetical protein